ncbi:MAG: DUF2917 domain-containing protein [Burkholderiaceae bacterium]|nr:DUF2917 domain-containing protein [Burkholderiaceae bacterium]
MKYESTFGTLSLAGGTLVPFSSKPGKLVRVLSGRVWITVEGNVHDAFLSSGEEIGLDSRGLVVIEALAPARIEWIDPVRQHSSIVSLIDKAFSAVRNWWKGPASHRTECRAG